MDDSEAVPTHTQVQQNVLRFVCVCVCGVILFNRVNEIQFRNFFVLENNMLQNVEEIAKH